MTDQIENNGNENLSPTVLKRLKEVLGENYDYATAVLIYTEVQSLEYQFNGLLDFTDALTHVKRAIYAEDDKKALAEIDSASDHIRHAAVESMQQYIEFKYLDIRLKLNSKIIYLFKLDKNKLKSLDIKLKSNIIKGREFKTTTNWKQSIAYFKEAEEILNEIEKEIPEVDDKINKYKIIFIYLLIGFFTGYLLTFI